MWRFLSLLLISLSAEAFDEKAALRDSQAAIGRPVADYRFTDSNGKPVTLSELRGKPLVVNFVYTGCISVCPTTSGLPRSSESVTGLPFESVNR